MQDGLARTDRDDDVRLDERGVDAMDATGHLDRPQILVLAVVHGDPAAKAPGAVGTQQQLELAASGAAAQAAGNEHRLPLSADVEQLELVEHGGEDVATGILLDRRQREGGQLHDDRGAPAARRQLAQRLPRQRVAERLGDRRADVDERIKRRRRHDEHGVVGKRDDGNPGAGVEGDATHAGHLHEPTGGETLGTRSPTPTGPDKRRAWVTLDPCRRR